LSLLPDWKGKVLADPSRQAWLEVILFRWVPHAISINHKSKRVSYSKLLLTALMEHKANGFQRIITGDGVWFFLDYPYGSVWAAPHEELSQRIRQKIDGEKCLVSILWSVNGIRSLLDVPKETTDNTAFLTDVVMPSLIENVRARTRRKTLNGWLIHTDNVRPHNSSRAQRCIKGSSAERLPGPDYNSAQTWPDWLLLIWTYQRINSANGRHSV
jgi:hypothetical protein